MNLLKKLYDMRDKKKADNKGFSLVELIIVIAIMAILVGIVGTQVIPYIEKSRKAKDTQVLSGLCTDATTAYGSTAAKLNATKTYTITITTSVVVAGGDQDAVATATDNDDLKKAFTELNNVSKVADLKLASKDGKDVDKITITCNDSGVKVVAAKAAAAAGGTDTEKFDPIESK